MKTHQDKSNGGTVDVQQPAETELPLRDIQSAATDSVELSSVPRTPEESQAVTDNREMAVADHADSASFRRAGLQQALLTNFPEHPEYLWGQKSAAPGLDFPLELSGNADHDILSSAATLQLSPRPQVSGPVLPNPVLPNPALINQPQPTATDPCQLTEPATAMPAIQNQKL